MDKLLQMATECGLNADEAKTAIESNKDEVMKQMNTIRKTFRVTGILFNQSTYPRCLTYIPTNRTVTHMMSMKIMQVYRLSSSRKLTAASH